jgi:hypothetical protein
MQFGKNLQNVLEDCTVSIFRSKNKPSKQQASSKQSEQSMKKM